MTKTKQAPKAIGIIKHDPCNGQLYKIIASNSDGSVIIEYALPNTKPKPITGFVVPDEYEVASIISGTIIYKDTNSITIESDEGYRITYSGITKYINDTISLAKEVNQLGERIKAGHIIGMVKRTKDGLILSGKKPQFTIAITKPPFNQPCDTLSEFTKHGYNPITETQLAIYATEIQRQQQEQKAVEGFKEELVREMQKDYKQPIILPDQDKKRTIDAAVNLGLAAIGYYTKPNEDIARDIGKDIGKDIIIADTKAEKSESGSGYTTYTPPKVKIDNDDKEEPKFNYNNIILPDKPIDETAILLISAAVAMATGNPILAVGAAALTSSMLPYTEATTVGQVDYPTTLYCGPGILCNAFARDAAAFGIDVRRAEVGESLERNTKVKRVIFDSHGSLNGGITGPQGSEMSPALATRYFPNFKILHSLACYGGRGVDYHVRNLQDNKIAFIHAGEEMMPIFILEQTAFNLVTTQSDTFLFGNPIHIIYKPAGLAAIKTKIEPFPLEKVNKLLAAKKLTDRNLSEEEKNAAISELYDFITDFFRTEKEHISSAFNTEVKGVVNKIISGLYDFITDYTETRKKVASNTAKAKKIAYAELERLGYKDYKKDVSLEEKINIIATPLLFQAAYHNDLQTFEALIKILPKEYLTKKIYVGTNIAFVAALKGHANIIRALTKAGFPAEELNVHSSDNIRSSAHSAVEYDFSDVIMAMHEAGAKNLNEPRKRDGTTPFYLAATNGKINVVKTFLKISNILELDTIDSESKTPLSAAIQFGKTETAKTIIKAYQEARIPISQINKKGSFTPFYQAVASRNLEIANIIMQAYIDEGISLSELNEPIVADNNYRAVFIAATTLNNHSMLDAMATAGFPVEEFEKPISDGATPMFGAATNGHVNAVRVLSKILTSAGRSAAQLNTPATNGETPADVAAENKHFEVLLELAKNGVDIYAKNKQSEKSPIEIAVEKGCPEELKKQITDAYSVYLEKSKETIPDNAMKPNGGETLASEVRSRESREL